MNIENRQWTRMVRREAREDLDDLWGETGAARDYMENGCSKNTDIFHLRKLFGMEPYKEDAFEFGSKNWDAPNKIQVSIAFVILYF